MAHADADDVVIITTVAGRQLAGSLPREATSYGSFRRRSHARQLFSIRPLTLTRRLALVVSALLAASIGAGVAVAYHEIRLAAELTEPGRIQPRVHRVAALFGAPPRARLTTLKRLVGAPA